MNGGRLMYKIVTTVYCCQVDYSTRTWVFKKTRSQVAFKELGDSKWIYSGLLPDGRLDYFELSFFTSEIDRSIIEDNTILVETEEGDVYTAEFKPEGNWDWSLETDV